jgi:hypothetical protein
MLTDHKLLQERWPRESRERRKLPPAFGKFIAGLVSWDWFFNPLSFRDGGSGCGAPVPDFALRQIKKYLLLVQRDAGRPIGWVLAEEFGRLGGRWHCHMLITGVRQLSRDFWRREACRRFGYTRIEAFNPLQGGPYHTAKYEGRSPGEIHFGGTLAGVDLAMCEQSRSRGGGHDVAVSVALPKLHFRMILSRWHRSSPGREELEVQTLFERST